MAMPSSIVVATTSMAALEDYAPFYNLRHPDPAENLKFGLEKLDAAGRQKPDQAVLPETFTAAGLPSHTIHSVAQPIPGPAFDAISDCARRHTMNVVAGFFFISDGDSISN